MFVLVVQLTASWRLMENVGSCADPSYFIGHDNTRYTFHLIISSWSHRSQTHSSRIVANISTGGGAVFITTLDSGHSGHPALTRFLLGDVFCDAGDTALVSSTGDPHTMSDWLCLFISCFGNISVSPNHFSQNYPLRWHMRHSTHRTSQRIRGPGTRQDITLSLVDGTFKVMSRGCGQWTPFWFCGHVKLWWWSSLQSGGSPTVSNTLTNSVSSSVQLRSPATKCRVSKDNISDYKNPGFWLVTFIKVNITQPPTKM